MPTTTELAPGVHRVETVTDDKLHGYHVLDGPSGPILVDPGYQSAPEEVYEPFLDERGQSLADVDAALVTHADADHHGAIAELREHSPGVSVLAHAADVPLIESTERIMTDRYGRYSADGITYDDDVTGWLRGMMGPDDRVDVALRGGESIAVADRRLEVLHTPGHTRGHVMLYDPAHGLVIGADGFFGRGLCDVNDTYLQPPPYLFYPEYENTIQLVDALDPETLSFTHYELLEGADIGSFIEESLDTVAEFETLARDLAASGPITLEGAIDETVQRLGSFGLDLDLAHPLSAHFRDLTERGELAETTADGRRAWEQA
jgi:glyoxylase-like metal-dependent hydrolase (beta-lactamase superfamily II)